MIQVKGEGRESWGCGGQFPGPGDPPRKQGRLKPTPCQRGAEKQTFNKYIRVD